MADPKKKGLKAQEIPAAVEATGDKRLLEKFWNSVTNARRTLELYGLEGCAFSFNGGKDSTVLLHLLRVAIYTEGFDSLSNNAQLADMMVFTFAKQDDFPEIKKFVKESSQQYGLDVVMRSETFKEGLEMFVHNGIRAIFMGTRQGDPNSQGQGIFTPSSMGWPPFMRVNPIWDWTYAEVWKFLGAIHAPICSLYEIGYTSVGQMKNTLPNEELRRDDGTYRPAWELVDGRAERAGRDNTARLRRSTSRRRTYQVGILIVGNEVLSASVEDRNTHFLCQQFREIGWRVARVVIVEDDVAAISDELRAMSEEYDIVVTAGGVGPTMDDVTMTGVAQALGRKVIMHPDLVSRLSEFYGAKITPSHFKMAQVPDGEVTLHEAVHSCPNGCVGRSPYPLVQCRNIFVLPGVPSILQKKFQDLRQHLVAHFPQQPFVHAEIRLSAGDETLIADVLESVSRELDPSISLGSYPVSGRPDNAGIILTIDSKEKEEVAKTRERLLGQLPQDLVLGVTESSNHTDG